MKAKVEKICEDFSRDYAKVLENGGNASEAKIAFEQKLIKATAKQNKLLTEKDTIIKEQLEEIATQRLEVNLQKALLREMRARLDQFNLEVEGWDRYTFDKNEQSFFNILPPKFTLDEFHSIGAAELGLSEGTREGLMLFYQRFHLITEKFDGSYSKMIDRVPENLNEINYIKDRVSLMVD